MKLKLWERIGFVAFAGLSILVVWSAADLIGLSRLANFTAADWASWVQAIGSLIGLAVAIYLPHREREAQRKGAHRVAEAFACSVVSALSLLASEIANDRGHFAFKTVKSRLRNSSHGMANIRLELLAPGQLPAIEGIRSLVDVAINFIEAAEQGKKLDASATEIAASYVAAGRRFGSRITPEISEPADEDF